MTASTIPVASTGSLDQRLAREERALALRSIAAALFAGVAIALVVLALSAVLLDGGRWLTLPRIVPVLAWLSGLVGAIVVGIALRRRDRARLTRAAVAMSIEREQALRTGSLRGAIEVAGTGELGAYAASNIARKLKPTGSLAPLLTQSFNRTAAIAGGLAIIGVASLTLSARATEDGISALRHPVAAFRGLLLPPLQFVGLPTDVPRGMPLTLRIGASGRNTIDVKYSTAGEAERDTTLQVDPVSGQATLALGPITSPVTVRVSDGRATDAVATIAVADRGWIGDVILHAEYPGYLQRVNERLEPVSPIRVPQGTGVRVRAMLRGGATDARLTNGTDTVLLNVEPQPNGDAAVNGRLVVSRDEEWRWMSSPTNQKGGGLLQVETPEALAFTVVPDLSPRIAIVSPALDTTISASGAVGVIVQASDDHGLGAIALQIWKERADAPSGERERIAIAEPGLPVWDGGATIALSGRDLQPGDKLHVVAVAIDDSPWRQSTQSAELVLRVPSLSEQRAMARDLADSLAARAAQMASQEKQLHQQTVDASRSRDLQSGNKSEATQSGGDAKSGAQKNAMSSSTAERAKELGRQQQQMGDKIDSLRQQAKELEDRLKSAGALDTAMQNRMRDIQKMLREAMTPEMQKQLQELQKNAQELNGTQAQQSLEQLAQQQKQMRDQLEKSAEMLKRAALEGAMQTLSDEAKDLAKEQKQLADQMQGKQKAGEQSGDPKTLADRSRSLEREVDKLAKRLDDAGAKPGANKTKAAQPQVDQAADAMQRVAQNSQQQQGQQQQGQQNAQQGEQKAGEQKAGEQGAQQQGQGEKNAAADSARKAQQEQLNKALANLQDKNQQKDANAQAQKEAQQTPPGSSGGSGSQSKQSQGSSGADQSKQTQQTSQDGKDGTRSGQQGQQQSGNQQSGQQQQGNQQAAQDAQQAASAMDKAAQQLSDARDAQVSAWKGELTDQLDRSINETQQLARQQAELEQRMKQEGASGVRGEQGAVQQGVQQAAEQLEQAGRNSSLLSQRSQKAMGEAQKKVQDATQALSNSQQAGGQQQAQNAMKEATEALNQALGSLVRDRERVNNAQSASGFTEMMEQMKQLAQQQSSLNGQMQGLSMLPGGQQGAQAQQQARVLARQQREVAKSLQDVSDADATGRTDALAKEAQQIASQMERQGLDPNVAARQQQLYRRLLDAGKFLEQDERDEQGPREARAGSGEGRGGNVNGPASGKNASKFAPPTWNELRGLGPEERRLVIEYFRRINGNNP